MAYLCIKCHDEYDTTPSQTKRWQPDELKIAKTSLENYVKSELPEYELAIGEEAKQSDKPERPVSVETYKLRYPVYEAFEIYVISVLREANIDAKARMNFLNATSQAYFLFGEEIEEYLSEVHKKSLEVIYDADGTMAVSADVCLVAVGRGPVTDGLGLEDAGIALHEKGFVNVDGQLRTNVEHVWAVGDVAATPLQLAHVAFTEGYAVAERIAGIEVADIDYVNIPRVTYCTPEIASVGLTEAQAVERGHQIVTEKLDFRAIGKANIIGEGGFVKVVAEAEGGPVLGIHMIGPHVTDLIAEAQLITNWEAVPSEVAALIHPHPTLSEAVGEAHLALAGKPLHSA